MTRLMSIQAGRLFEVVEIYLIEQGYDFAHGKDIEGHVGAFHVYPSR